MQNLEEDIKADLEKQHYEESIRQEHVKRELEKQAHDLKVQKIKTFHETIAQSEDLNDNLQYLVDIIAENTGATGVYIGKLVPPTRPIKDNSDDHAHIVENQPKVVRYIHTTPNHSYMVNKTLTAT